MNPTIDRGFQRIGSGLVHYREVGGNTAELPLVMIHGGPGSSAGLVPMISVLSAQRRVIAPDVPGNGDSDPLPVVPTSIASYAETILEFLSAMGVDRFDLYGHHSGAQIACEIAIERPAQVRRMVLDGVALFSPEQRREFHARYAPPIVPVADGSHLIWAWDFASNLTRFFPHYRRDDIHRLVPETIQPPDIVTRIALDLMKVWPTYHLLYEAAFAHDFAERLAHVATPTLVLEIAGDPLAQYVGRAARLLPESRTIATSREDRGKIIADFLAPVARG
jgi:pimeloyl-ACP methyl ester carboxylesterase